MSSHVKLVLPPGSKEPERTFNDLGGAALTTGEINNGSRNNTAITAAILLMMSITRWIASGMEISS